MRFFRLLRPSRPMTALALSIAVVMLALTIPKAVAQSSRKLPPGLASANVAINEGRYDEVATLTAQLDAQDPAVVAVRARAMIAPRPLRRGDGGAPAGGGSRAVERGGARAWIAPADAQPSRGARRAQPGRVACALHDRCRRDGPRRPRPAGPESVRGGAGRLSRCRNRGAARRVHQRRVGRVLPRAPVPDVQHRGGEVVPDGAGGGSAPCPGDVRPGARGRQRQPARRHRHRAQDPRGQPVACRDAPVSRGTGRRRRQARRSAPVDSEGAVGEPVEPRRPLAAGGPRLRRGQDAGVRGARWPRCWRCRRDTPRSTGSPPSTPPTPTGSTRRSRWCGARWASRRATSRRSPISGCTCCAPATRVARATRSNPPSS